MASYATQLDLGETYGAFYLGLVASAIFFGMTNIQVFVYYASRPKDSFWYKLMVFGLWLGDAVQLAFVIHVVYFYLVQNYDNPLRLNKFVWSFRAQLVMDALVIVIVQTLYAIRLVKLNARERRWLPWVVGVIILGAYTVAIVQCWGVYSVDTFSEVVRIRWTMYMTFPYMVFADSILAFSMCWVLAQGRRYISKSTASTVKVLMVYIINCGVLTSFCSLVALICYVTMPSNFVFLSVEFLFTKLYVNSYLAMLNARPYLATRLQQTHLDHEMLRDAQFSSTTKSDSTNSRFRSLYGTVLTSLGRPEAVHVGNAVEPVRVAFTREVNIDIGCAA